MQLVQLLSAIEMSYAIKVWANDIKVWVNAIKVWANAIKIQNTKKSAKIV